MSSEKTSVSNKRKRQLSVEVELTTNSLSSLIVKRRKLENQQRHRTLSWFWDNLSRQLLTRRALRELNRRTMWSATSVSPDWIDKKINHPAQLKRFARHDESSLSDLRAVSSIKSFSKNSFNFMSVFETLNRSFFQSNNELKSIELQKTNQDWKRIEHILEDQKILCLWRLLRAASHRSWRIHE